MIRNRKVKDPIVAITKGMSEGRSLEKALDLLPMDKIIQKGDKVIITPNCVKYKSPKDGVVVGPKTLKKLIQYIKTKEPSKIVIATGSGGAKTPDVMKSVGYDKIIEEENLEFVDMNYGPFRDLELNHEIIKSTPINEVIKDADVIISFTQLKYHEEATVTAAIKNISMGYPPASIHGYPKKQTGIHEDLHGFIRAFAKYEPEKIDLHTYDKQDFFSGFYSDISDYLEKNGENIGFIPNGLDFIPCNTFQNCEEIEEPFIGCSSLETVYFECEQEDICLDYFGIGDEVEIVWGYKG